MYKNFVAILLISLSFVSCSMQKPMAEEKISPSQKVFPEEDMYILFALRAEQIGDNASAAELFNTLYEKSNRKKYLYKSLESDLRAKQNQKVIQRVDTLTQGSFNDYQLVRLKIIALVEDDKMQEAKKLSLALLDVSHKEEDYILVANIYAQLQEYDMALKYLESAYNKNYSEVVLDRMSIILYANLHRTKDAIAQLETHSRIHGYSTLVCNRLLGIYSNENNIDGLLSTYLRLYALNKDEKTAKKIIQIYGYKQDYLKLIDFLEESKADDVTLLQLYSVTKNYKKAQILADKLYKEKGDISYLGQSAIYEYEASGKRDDKKLLQSVITKLKKVTKQDSSPLYLNYLGYILIDHEIDVKQGIKYIKQVLKIQPDSSFYLDSLAWGYYKLGNCSKAKKIMNKVETLEGADEPEVLQHIKEINKCLKNKKGKKK